MTMRRLFALALAFGMLSCSKNDTLVVPTNGAADVKLALRQASVERGDTAWMTLRVSSPPFPSTTIVDLGDSCSVQFMTAGLRYGTTVLDFDTLFWHIYARAGSYQITASVVWHGLTTATATVPVSIHNPLNRSFQCDLSVGMVWRFSYREVDFDSRITGKDYERWGIHEWRILGLTVGGADTLYQATEIRRDSVHYQAWSPGSPTIDTLYAKNEDLPFTITKSSKSIFFDWPSTVISDSVKFMPRVVPYSTPDSVLVYWRLQDWYSIFKENIGPVRSHWIDGGNNPHGEDLSLLEFIKP